ncbi:MAG: esterase-like activity of phytase family protein [Henriciella sp.]|nr:esterase-like activity of phytase family protein [Henriciella sp.]
MRSLLATSTFIALTACAAPEPTPGPAAAVPADVSSEIVPSLEAWDFETAAADLRAASCPDGVEFTRAQSLPLGITEIDRGPDAQADAIAGLVFAGAWHLTADNPSFGGLSGLDTLRSGSLLAVSDAGAFVQIGIDPDTGAPDGLGSISYMLGAEGRQLKGKTSADAEGLVFKNGLALVSFERDHRIEAFDLEGCGAAARAARVADLPGQVEGEDVPNNRGAEALSFDDQLFIGFEFRGPKGAPTTRLMEDGSLDLSLYERPPAFHLQTGSDLENGGRATVFRAYDPVRGNRILVEVTTADGRTGEARLKSPLPVDNFEGIAFGTNPESQTRIWLISDDNFNPDNQRTLLFAFDVLE